MVTRVHEVESTQELDRLLSHWTEHLPVWQLLSALGDRRDLGGVLHLVDTVDEAVEVLDQM